jgi:uncharacterized protein
MFPPSRQHNNENAMKKLIAACLILATQLAMAAPELKGSPDDLRQFLHPSDKTVTLYAESEERAYSDKAVVSLIITTEDKQLSASISRNGDLRQEISQQLVSAGIVPANIKSSKFSSSPNTAGSAKSPTASK